MRRKILSLLLTFIMFLNLSLVASGDSLYKIDGDGFIGLSHDELDGLITISIPNNFHWYVSQDTLPNVACDYTYEIHNYSQNADLEVTLVSFQQINDVEVENLTLNLTGDLLSASGIGEDIVNFVNTGNEPYPDLMEALDTWRFSFNGTYLGSIHRYDVLRPSYSMELNFKVKSLNFE